MEGAATDIFAPEILHLVFAQLNPYNPGDLATLRASRLACRRYRDIVPDTVFYVATFKASASDGVVDLFSHHRNFVTNLHNQPILQHLRELTIDGDTTFIPLPDNAPLDNTSLSYLIRYLPGVQTLILQNLCWFCPSIDVTDLALQPLVFSHTNPAPPGTLETVIMHFVEFIPGVVVQHVQPPAFGHEPSPIELPGLVFAPLLINIELQDCHFSVGEFGYMVQPMNKQHVLLSPASRCTVDMFSATRGITNLVLDDLPLDPNIIGVTHEWLDRNRTSLETLTIGFGAMVIRPGMLSFLL